MPSFAEEQAADNDVVEITETVFPGADDSGMVEEPMSDELHLIRSDISLVTFFSDAHEAALDVLKLLTEIEQELTYIGDVDHLTSKEVFAKLKAASVDLPGQRAFIQALAENDILPRDVDSSEALISLVPA